MSITLSGKVLTNAGSAVSGASVKAFATTDLINAVSSATSGADGTWSITGLDPNDYAVSVEKDGKYRWYWGPSSIQLARLTVGKEAVVLASTGNVDLTNPSAVLEAGKIDSPTLSLHGAYDSDGTPADGNITKTAYGAGLQALVTVTDGVPSAALQVIKDDLSATGIVFNEDGSVVAKKFQQDGGYDLRPKLYTTTTLLATTHTAAQGWKDVLSRTFTLGTTSLVHVDTLLNWNSTSTNPADYGLSVHFTKDGGAETKIVDAEMYRNQTGHNFSLSASRSVEWAAGEYVVKVKAATWTTGATGTLNAASYLDVTVTPSQG